MIYECYSNLIIQIILIIINVKLSKENNLLICYYTVHFLAVLNLYNGFAVHVFLID